MGSIFSRVVKTSFTRCVPDVICRCTRCVQRHLGVDNWGVKSVIILPILSLYSCSALYFFDLIIKHLKNNEPNQGEKLSVIF